MQPLFSIITIVKSGNAHPGCWLYLFSVSTSISSVNLSYNWFKHKFGLVVIMSLCAAEHFLSSKLCHFSYWSSFSTRTNICITDSHGNMSAYTRIQPSKICPHASLFSTLFMHYVNEIMFVLILFACMSIEWTYLSV